MPTRLGLVAFDETLDDRNRGKQMAVQGVILRFSGESTIEAHQRIIAETGLVWWAWWRKDSQEPKRLELLEKLREAVGGRPQDIYLVNRKDDKYYRAQCNAVEFSSTGERIASPDAGSTPEYYRTQAFPAWFRFTAISEIDLPRLEAACGGYPVGNPTMFEVVSSDGGLELRPKPNWDVEAVGAPGEGILHLSDLHFGDDHAYGVESAHNPLPTRRLAPVVEEIITESGVQIGVVVVAGDLITQADYPALADFEAFAEELRARLGLQRHHFVIVPGNHDFDVVSDPVRMKENYRHEVEFRRFMRSFFARDLQDLERIQRFRTPKGTDILFFALNSARLRGEDTKQYGYVGAHRYQAMIQWAIEEAFGAQQNGAARLAVAVMHHHIMPVQPIEHVSARPISLTADANEVRENLQRLGVQALLHGHQHLPFVGVVNAVPVSRGKWGHMPPQPLHIIGNGTSGARRTPTQLNANTLGIHEVEGDGLRVRFYSYLNDRRAEKVVDCLLPLT